MLTILKPSELKDNTGKVLDAAKKNPQYVVRDDVLLVIQRADFVPESGESEVLTSAKRRSELWDKL
ncbi:MAG TPA: hypothetical protein PKA41_19475 [Verrucomicrobiota bacterium]|nr:hypothetical protein [Verrucomicrobiota bacterium]